MNVRQRQGGRRLIGYTSNVTFTFTSRLLPGGTCQQRVDSWVELGTALTAVSEQPTSKDVYCSASKWKNRTVHNMGSNPGPLTYQSAMPTTSLLWHTRDDLTVGSKSRSIYAASKEQHQNGSVIPRNNKRQCRRNVSTGLHRQRLQTEFGVSGISLSWFQSYLQDRTQFVKLGQRRSSETTLEVGGIGTRSAAVRRVFQSSRWRHHVPWRPMPSIRRWHSAPPSDARRQHSCWPVHSRRLYHWRQAVVHAERNPSESRQVRGA